MITSVLFVGARRTEALKAARTTGLRVLFLGPTTATSAQLAWCDTALLLSEFNPEAALQAAIGLHQLSPFDLAWTNSDSYLEAAARINEKLGLRSNSVLTVMAVNNKATMREVLRDTAVAPVRSAPVRSIQDLRAFAETAGFPVILKPTQGSGSRDIHSLAGPDDVEAVASQVELADSDAADWTVEEFLTGREFSVETHSTDGQHHVLAVTEKFTTGNFVEIGHVVPARVTAAEHAALSAEVKTVLTALGVLQGPCHTEVILTDAGPRLVETHTRPGGDAIVELVRLTTGIDMNQLNFSSLTGEPTDMERQPSAGAAAIWFHPGRPGKVTAVAGVEEAKALDGVEEAVLMTKVGDVVGPLRSSGDRVAYTLATGDDADSALDRAQTALATIAVDIEPENSGEQ
ncbi:MAG TPA: ATP-grasp domain-containing protein [Trebonia sp.]|nr:ATP-grasp domain-containing protein [Trebonia sp.]